MMTDGKNLDVAQVTNKLLGKKFKFRFGAVKTIDRAKMESESQWDVLAFDMAFLRFPKDWEVAVIPPFRGATCRFRARLIGEEDSVSVYFDTEDALGSCGRPYWEAYPVEGDTKRFFPGEEIEMIKAIDKELKEWKRKREKKAQQ